MVGMIRSWLLGIVKQAIREVEAEKPRYDSASIPLLGEIPQRITQSSVRVVPRYRFPDVAPISFEKEQEQALRAQDEFWQKQVKSDV